MVTITSIAIGPGTVLAQLGPGIKTAQYTLAGGVLGAIAYGFLDTTIGKLLGTGSTADSLESVLSIL